MRMLSSPSRVSTRAYRTAERCVVANAAAERELAPLLRAAILALLLKEGDGSAEAGQGEVMGGRQGRGSVMHVHGNPLFAGEGEGGEKLQEDVVPGSRAPGLGVPSLPVP